MNKRDKIEERLANIEDRQFLLKEALLDLIDRPKKSLYQKSFALYALLSWFTAAELEEIEALFRWATHQSKRRSLAKEEVIKKFEKRLPRRKGELFNIAERYKAENKFPHICEVILNGQKKKSDDEGEL